MSLLSRIDWPEVDVRTRSEQGKRELYSPWVSVFRWWARRPSSVVAAILDAGRLALGERYLVSDCFSGGGTVAFEAASRGLPVYAQDLYPWPTSGLAAGLAPVKPEAFALAANELLEALTPLRREFACGDNAELSHIIRVRTLPCPSCERLIYLFRRPLISMRSRSPNEAHGYFGCSRCGGVTLRRTPAERFTCCHCRHRSSLPPPPGRRGSPRHACPHCREVFPVAEMLATIPSWKPVLVQAVHQEQGRRPRVVIRPVSDGDPVSDSQTRPKIGGVQRLIPGGVETSCLLRDGYRRWSDLYTNRQLRVLHTALGEIERSSHPEPVLGRLRIAVIGACEMAGYLSRWEPYYPKAFEATANHRFARITVSAETNLLAQIGRGTLPRRFAAAAKAIEWWGKRQWPKVKVLDADSRRRRHSQGVLIAVGSSRRQLLSPGQVDLLLTDPPYHDDIQYGELARLFHAWLAASGQVSLAKEREEVVPNRFHNTPADWYQRAVTECLAEGRRTLKSRGRLVLTYHNNELEAWRALGQAIGDAGFTILALATAVSENMNDHCKRDRHVFSHDLVIEGGVASGTSPRLPPAQLGCRDTDERKNLLAVGRVIADPGLCGTRSLFREAFKQNLVLLDATTTLIE